ncbi:Ankyrin repeat domain-containing protein SOWAHC [Labeo rohita]|uniref:Ankyrin repeat domain-containing protein SOWAHC n=1 Tax=Labeo rohita TaxID=84645 RepID=A0ABQ8M1S1_LABRO|nr:ankyrin repeat domain-containing protein SOWAHC [Labeo rohita]XP_050983991.1 ankyrin repeat domain-containing protein SOWAHC [Labeo rohita]XP_050983992.1 ankyrin repeat domain-containing protein SOWAHC [Labeo rohita]KAI2656856.1 Ankyrin repeat domain-containing protein SOWAHC [Labeo rohita]
MYKGSSGPTSSEEHFNDPVGEAAQPSEEPKDSEASCNNVRTSDSPKSRIASQFRANLEERLSRHGARPSSPALSASSRRSRFQKQLEEPGSSASRRLSVDTSGSITPAMRKKYLKELLLNNKSGLSSILSSKHISSEEEDASASYGDTLNSGAIWALDPMEHAWMLSAVDGNYDTMLEFLAEDSSLLSRKDFISGFTALHWLAKNGKDETLIQLLRHAEKEGLSVNVNLRGSGGLTPLHVAAMHNQYMVVKALVGAFSANIDIMDYSGKRAWQYLKDKAPREMKELLGAWDDEHSVGYLNVNNSASQAQPVDEHSQEKRVEVDGSGGISRQRFSSFRRLLYNIGLIENI